MSNGWNQERRERQAKRIREWKPWNKSTGPKTIEGVERSSMNSFKHGAYTKEALSEMRYMKLMIKLSKINLSDIGKISKLSL